MKLVFESTERFEEEISFFKNEQRLLIVNKINKCFNLLLSNPQKFYSRVEQPFHFQLRNDYEFSLYVLTVSDNLGIIFTVDEDPIFEQIIITLFRLVETNEAGKAYQEVGNLLYHDFLLEKSKKLAVLT